MKNELFRSFGWGMSLGMLVGAGICITGLVIATDFWTMASATLCSTEEKNCLRDWISASSGWVAGVVTLIALGPVILQLRELKRQTMFSIGDERPEIEIWTNNNYGVYRFRIVNWNRRAFIIQKVKWTSEVDFQAMPELLVGKEIVGGDAQAESHIPIDQDGRLAQWVAIDGWENRGLPPNVKRFWQIARTDPQQLNLPPGSNTRAKIEVSGVLGGGHNKPVAITAEVPTLIDLIPNRGGPGAQGTLPAKRSRKT
ncbi:hypothetical protein J2858_000923 [Neorhizobium galegae]|uniref:hypothetical protein n=1 Tax=Neorhizobium galegae TaxID=399 RepID=UPI001AE22E16|nr:hypothetical protein [Neorhizobium galegae]MBP2548030.1 hypothetical protein [Neorhizobium galegae]